MANRKITAMTALTAPATDDVLPIVDVSEASATDKNKKITVQELFKGAPDGTESAPGIAFESNDGSGIYLAGTDNVAISTGGSQRVSVTNSGTTITGDLTVTGTTTTIESTTLTVDDKNIELGSVATPTDTTADGGGITLKGASDKEIKWVQSTASWTFNQSVSITDTGSLKIPVGTTAQRPSSPVQGMIRRNTTDSAFEGYTGNDWAPLGGGATGGGSDTWVVETDQTVTTSYELGSGKHGTTVSPTINSGATVTVPSGAILVIL